MLDVSSAEMFLVSLVMVLSSLALGQFSGWVTGLIARYSPLGNDKNAEIGGKAIELVSIAIPAILGWLSMYIQPIFQQLDAMGLWSPLVQLFMVVGPVVGTKAIYEVRARRKKYD